jgi:hypothetical protein
MSDELANGIQHVHSSVVTRLKKNDKDIPLENTGVQIDIWLS